MLNQIKEAVEFIQSKFNFQPEVGIILGTGLGGLVKEIAIEHTLDYSSIPHFPLSTVESHSGKLIFGKLGSKNVVAMQGRFHFYEGYSMQQVVFPVRVMKFLGISKLFVSNACGGLQEKMDAGDLFVITDHINLFPDNPLIGKNIDELGVRFPDMMYTYQPELIIKAEEILQNNNSSYHKGVYVGLTGPMLETPAEYNYLRIIGADVVGMSTVPEVIAARHMGLPCFAASIITDACAPSKLSEANLAEIIEVATKAEPKLTQLFKELISQS